MNANTRQAERSAEPGRSPWAPFRYAAFTVIWIALVVANVGTWMYNAASGWLMTSLDPDPLTVSLVQVATTLPIFLLAIPAGALADIADRRQFLLVMEIAVTAVSALFAAGTPVGSAA
jgi:MFS family permease